jgi:Rhodopirellula transposase DDE domain
MLVSHSDIQRRFRALSPFLDERMRRLVAAVESEAIGYGGVSAVARATGVSRRAITAGLKELTRRKRARSMPPAQSRIRRQGAGRKRTADKDPSLLEDLDLLVDPATRGDPESPLRWTCKSVRRLAEELQRAGHAVSYQTVAELLHAMEYSLQANQKTLEGSQHADRDEQFEHINRKAQRYLKQSQPVISVDTKKRELVGDFKNAGREWQAKGNPEPVRVHDFAIREPDKGKVAPYGVYDLGRNVGWVKSRSAAPRRFPMVKSCVSPGRCRGTTSWGCLPNRISSVGVDHDTAAFAVESIRRWWRWMGRASYPKATRLLITADSGGSNGARVRLWKWELQQLADETGLEIAVCHFPPGTSKWNKIEHRLFSFISQNWRGKPLISHEVIINLIAATTSKTGLAVKSDLDRNVYPAGVKVSDEQMAELRLRRDPFHGDWNYSLLPRT